MVDAVPTWPITRCISSTIGSNSSGGNSPSMVRSSRSRVGAPTNGDGCWSVTRVSRSVAARRTSAGSSPASRATCSSSASDMPLVGSAGASSS
jgi:hypothetical protein